MNNCSVRMTGLTAVIFFLYCVYNVFCNEFIWDIIFFSGKIKNEILFVRWKCNLKSIKIPILREVAILVVVIS